MAVGAVAGARGVGLALLVSVLALLMLTALSYAQHYGLTRVPDSPVRTHHAWNHLYPLTRGGMFEITTHSQHHMDVDVRYWELTPLPHAPQLPSAWACLLLALVPPLWERLLRRRLAFSDSLVSCVRRKTDFVFRYGGEEFVLILAPTSKQTVERMAKSIIRAANELPYIHEQSPHGRITVSLGGVYCDTTEDTDFEKLINESDGLLYQAKEAGRNRYIIKSL